MKIPFTQLLLITALLVGHAAHAATAQTALAQPADQGTGLDSARLTRLHDYLQAMTDAEHGRYLGAVSIIARHGRVVDVAAYGYRDMQRTEKLRADAIFQIYSMSKSVTAAALMLLLEEGKVGLEDPVSRFIPTFAGMRVYVSGSADNPVTRPAAGPITIRQLLTHTPGFSVYGAPGDALTTVFERANLDGAPDLAAYAERLSHTLLAHDPGREFHYDGVPTQVVARIVEVASGMPFDAFLRTRLFGPLKMVDTGFTVPMAQRHRIATMTTTDSSGRLIEAPRMVSELDAPGEQRRRFFSGAGGLYSTAPDYARFAQMLLNGGSLDGVRVLNPRTVQLMMHNHLQQLSLPIAGLTPGESFALGGSVVVDAARRGRLGSNGQYGWSGAGGTWYTVDPQEQLVAVLMTQHLPQGLPRDPRKPVIDYTNLLYQSLQP